MTTKKYIRPNDSRRSFIRVDFPGGTKIGILDQAVSQAYDGIDFSVYGLSFLVDQDAAPRFYLGREVPSIRFEIGGRTVQVGGKVAYLQTGLTGGLTRVAIEFTQIAIEDVWHLSRQVAERAGGESTMIELTEITPFEEGGARKKAKGKRPKAKKAAKKPAKKSAKKASKKATKKTAKKGKKKSPAKAKKGSSKKRARR